MSEINTAHIEKARSITALKQIVSWISKHPNVGNNQVGKKDQNASNTNERAKKKVEKF